MRSMTDGDWPQRRSLLIAITVFTSLTWGCQEESTDVAPPRDTGDTAAARDANAGGVVTDHPDGAAGPHDQGSETENADGASPTADVSPESSNSTSNESPGAGLTAPDDWPTTLEASFTTSSISVDGEVEKPYGDAKPLRFGDPAGRSDNAIEVRALWTEEALFISYEVADGSIAASPDANAWKNDGLEIFFDSENDGGSRLRNGDYHLIRTVDDILRVTRGSTSGQSPIPDADSIEHAAALGARGYRLELRIPWSTIEADVATRRTFGLLIGNNDRDDGSDGQVRQFAFEEISPFAQPDGFGTLELTGGPDPEEDPNDGDGLGRPPADAVHLCDQGLSPGDDIAPLLEQYHGNGETLLVCKGTYKLSSSLDLSGSNWKVVAAEGATLDIDGTPLIRLSGNNWQFSGFVFEQSGGSNAEVLSSGQDWQFTHIAWKGRHPGGRRLLVPWVTASGSTGIIDHVYMGDGQKPRSGSGAVWVNANANHAGQLYFRHVHVAQFVDNAIYSTGVPTQGHEGLTHVEDSYFRNNTIANARVGGLRGTAHVRNSVFILDGANPPCGVGCSSPGSTNTRAVWAWYGPVEVSNCDFDVTSGSTFATAKGGSYRRSNNRFGGEADLSPPKGVPMSAEWIFDHPPGYP